jgi:hypothetical protein
MRGNEPLWCTHLACALRSKQVLSACPDAADGLGAPTGKKSLNRGTNPRSPLESATLFWIGVPASARWTANSGSGPGRRAMRRRRRERRRKNIVKSRNEPTISFRISNAVLDWRAGVNPVDGKLGSWSRSKGNERPTGERRQKNIVKSRNEPTISFRISKAVFAPWSCRL